MAWVEMSACPSRPPVTRVIAMALQVKVFEETDTSGDERPPETQPPSPKAGPTSWSLIKRGDLHQG